MSKELHLNLQELHNLLENQPVDICTASSLQQMSDELNLSLAQCEGKIDTQAYQNIINEQIIAFSDQHPKLVAVLKRILNNLESIGV